MTEKSSNDSLLSVVSTVFSNLKNEFMLQISITAVLLAVPFYLVMQRMKPKKAQHLPYPPGPKANFLLGNVLELPSIARGELMETKLLEWSKDYGPVFSFAIPISNKIIVVADPVLAKQILVSKNYSKAPVYRTMGAAIFGKYSMLILEGEEWTSMRRSFNPGFAPDFLRTMLTTMANKLERFTAAVEVDIDSNQSTLMLERAQVFTSDVIVSIAFGEDWGGLNPHPARIWINLIVDQAYKVMLNPVRRLIDFKLMREIRKYEKLLDDLERRLAKETSAAESMDICSIAIAHMKSTNGTLSEKDKLYIIHQLKTFYIAGHDSTASTITWATWLMSNDHAVLEKLREELKSHDVWSDCKVPPTYEQLQKCSYLDAIIKETLRLYPPASTLTRYTADMSETYNEYCIGGVMLMVSPYMIHRHPTLWKEPDTFRPERFLDSSEQDISSKFLPFSRGPQDCIGKNFAMLEAKLAISALATRYEFECVDMNEEIYVQITLLPKNGGRVRFTRRTI